MQPNFSYQETRTPVLQNESTKPSNPSAYILAIPTDRFEHGLRVYQLELRASNAELIVLAAVSGRAETQDFDVHVPDRSAPLPSGTYLLDRPQVAEPPNFNPELGGIWIGAEPLFDTGRSDLGIHYDPSFGLSNGESGTEGCLAVVSETDRDLLWRWAIEFQPEYLEVGDR
jgi:hypothetical protein